MVLVGHSLGAGTAALLSLLLRGTECTPIEPSSHGLKVPPGMITCWGFGCPPCVDLNLANSASFINNVVLQVLSDALLLEWASHELMFEYRFYTTVALFGVNADEDLFMKAG